MLTKENAHSWAPASSYPRFEWKNEDEDFAAYQEMIKKEHEGLSDEKMSASPTGIFHGRGRNSRWMDEILRRNLK